MEKDLEDKTIAWALLLCHTAIMDCFKSPNVNWKTNIKKIKERIEFAKFNYKMIDLFSDVYWINPLDVRRKIVEKNTNNLGWIKFKRWGDIERHQELVNSDWTI